jgi:hypothetical protein
MPENKQFEVWSLDVWGDKEDGYIVNDRSKIGTVELSDEADKAEILLVMHNAGFIVSPFKEDMSCVEIIDNYPNWGIDYDGKPVFELTSEE